MMCVMCVGCVYTCVTDNGNFLRSMFYFPELSQFNVQWWQKESGPSAILSKKEQPRVKWPNKSRKTVIFVPEIQYVPMILWFLTLTSLFGNLGMQINQFYSSQTPDISP